MTWNPKLINQLTETKSIIGQMDYFPFTELPHELQYYILMIDLSIYPVFSMVCKAFHSLAHDRVIRQHYSRQHAKGYRLKIRTYRFVLNHTDQFVERFTRPEIVGGGTSSHYDNIDETGYPRIGAILKPGDCIIGKIRIYHNTNQTENASIFIGAGEEGTVDNILIVENEKKELTIRVKIYQIRPPVSGDKVAARYAKMGMIGWIIPDEEMPRIHSTSPQQLNTENQPTVKIRQDDEMPVIELVD